MLTNVVGALAEVAKIQVILNSFQKVSESFIVYRIESLKCYDFDFIQRNRDTINLENGLAPLIRLIATNHPALLVNVR